MVAPRRVSGSLSLAALCLAALTCSEPQAVPPRAPHRAAAGPPDAAPPRPAPHVQNKEKPVLVDIPAEPTGRPAGFLELRQPARFQRFYRRLMGLREGSTSRVRIAFFGDSHVAGEILPHHLRQRLQRVFGDGGPGFVIPGRPWRSYVHLAVKLRHTRGWRAERYSLRRPTRDDLFGVAGVSVHAPSGAATWISPRGERPLGALDVHYLRQPGGGKLEILADGTRIKWLFTVASTKEAAFARVELPAGTRRIELRATPPGEVRMFGVDLASGEDGVVVDTLGINGAQAAAVLEWNEELAGRQLARLAPDLIVVAYGTNEVYASSMTRARVAAAFDALLLRLRRQAPDAACLVVGPPDHARWIRGEGWTVPAKLDHIVAEQRRVARLRGCAFFNQRALMGGPGGVFTWARSDPPLVRGDHIHLYPRGYRAVAETLFSALMEGYARAACRREPAGKLCADARRLAAGAARAQ